MSSSPSLQGLFGALGDELSDWASASERLEVVIGNLLGDRSLSAAEIEAVQTIDGLSQHLRQLAELCRGLSDPQVRSDLCPEALAASLHRMNLAGLSDRLAGRAGGQRGGGGDVDLW